MNDMKIVILKLLLL